MSSIILWAGGHLRKFANVTRGHNLIANPLIMCYYNLSTAKEEKTQCPLYLRCRSVLQMYLSFGTELLNYILINCEFL